MYRLRHALVAVPLLALLLPATASAQQQEQQVQEWQAELQQIHAQLQPLQERALENEELQQQRAATTAALRAAMIDADPEIGPSLDRLEAMMEEVQAAQASGDADRIIALTLEAQEIQPRIARAQAQAVAREDVQAQIASFQEKLRDRMVELDPAAARLFERVAELEDRIRGAG
jgi:chromosome segregation ATPase